jgi:hypothetical protein
MSTKEKKRETLARRKIRRTRHIKNLAEDKLQSLPTRVRRFPHEVVFLRVGYIVRSLYAHTHVSAFFLPKRPVKPLSLFIADFFLDGMSEKMQ